MSFERKNVAIFIDSLGGGGAERVMLNLAKGLIQLGHRAHIFCLEARREHEIPNDVPVSILYEDRNLKKIARGRYIKPSAEKLESLVANVEQKEGGFNLYLANLDPTNAVVAKCKFKNVYYVLHNAMKQEIAREKKLGPIKWYRKVKVKKILNGKDLVAVSKGVENETKEISFLKPHSVRTIYNPIDIESVKSLSNKALEGIPKEPYLVHVGRVVKQKRHDVLFDALSRVPDIKLVLLCKDIDKAKALAKQFGVEERLIFPGFTNNPYAWFKKAELSLISSDYEGLPTVILESLLCGTPVVSTNCNFGPSEMLTGELAEYLSPVGDAAALASNIIKALEKKPKVKGVEILDKVELEYVAQRYLELAN